MTVLGMEWWEFATLIFAALSFLGMCWQIVRAESLAPTPTLHIEWDNPIKESDKTVQVTLWIRPAFGFDFYGVKVLEATDWPYRRECWLKRDERKVTEDDPLFHRLRYPVDGSGSFVIQVLSVSPIRKRLIACAWKVTATDGGEAPSDTKQQRLLTETRSWWVWYPGAELLGLLDHRLGWKIPLGYWREGKGSYRAALPLSAIPRSS